ncbi:uncharacterized protein LOC109947482 [Prunus persica]|uniref:uncharacterized protein LOC109947482 n=1 Tax=Prunus persica TaxID=3760 RepID=UPI0009ABA1B5|nr:uncharacterized protein LOC109947482 [Prunus persica]
MNVTQNQVYRAKKLAKKVIQAGFKKGFVEGCRPVVGVDGCHLKGPCSGQILTAVGVDGNNDLGIQNGLAWVFISDKQNGLIPAMQTVLPNTEHRMCVRHLYNNFRGQHTGLALKHLLCAAAKATTLPWWEPEMDNLKKEDADAWRWLIEKPAKHWSRSHFATHYKCDLLLNNLCESFNATIINARDKPILTCLERIKMYIMIRMANRRASCQHWRYTVGPRIFNIIEKNKLASSQCIPRLAGEKKYQISHMYEGEFAVDLRAKTCSCRRWDLCGIPCPHAISAIFQRSEDIEDYVDKLYKKEAYLKTYGPIIRHVPFIDQWPRSCLLVIKPPNFRIQPGRPRKVRTQEPGKVEIPAPVPSNPKPPNWKPQPARLQLSKGKPKL